VGQPGFPLRERSADRSMVGHHLVSVMAGVKTPFNRREFASPYRPAELDWIGL
jgi:hypothetical protein